MPRTANPELRQVRRDAFLDVAQRLIQAEGYEAVSVQDVIDELEASRGAFYHYFDSKEALLDAVIERFTDTALAAVEPIMADPSLRAPRKLERVLGRIAELKAGNKELMVAVIRTWSLPGNALTREKARRLAAERLGPIFARIIRQGIEEGSLTATYPEETARAVLAMAQGVQELAAEYFLARQAGTVTFEACRRTFAAFTEAFERIVGAPPGSVTLADESTLKFWFG